MNTPWKADKEIRFPLPNDAEVRILFRGPITQDALEMVRDVLLTSKRGFPILAKIEKTRTPPTVEVIPLPYEAAREG